MTEVADIGSSDELSTDVVALCTSVPKPCSGSPEDLCSLDFECTKATTGLVEY